MAKKHWFPSPEADRVEWLTNYLGKIPTHGPTCGLDGGELAETQTDLTFLIWLLGTWHPAIKQDLEEATAYKRIIANGPGVEDVDLPEASTFPTVPAVRPPGVLTRLFNQVGRMKMNGGYTEALGLDLRVIGVEDGAVHPVPEFTLVVEQGDDCQCARIDFTKFGHDGVHIEYRRNNGAWTFVAVDTEKPYVHDLELLTANTAETREYRLRFWDKGTANGDWSPVQKVTVGA